MDNFEETIKPYLNAAGKPIRTHVTVFSVSEGKWDFQQVHEFKKNRAKQGKVGRPTVPVHTPSGWFPSPAMAAEAYGVTRLTIRERVRNPNMEEWYNEDTDGKV